MAEYSKQFLEAIRHPRIQGMIRKRFDKILFKNQIYHILSVLTNDLFVFRTIKNNNGIEISDYAHIKQNECLFIPQIYGSKNPFGSLIGMLGNQYTIEKYPYKSKTWYDIKFEFKRKNEKFLSERVMRGTDFQLTLLEAVIFKKTGQTWNKKKMIWSEALYKF